MNVELLRQIQTVILEEPKRVDMGDWIDSRRTNLPECGTVGCIYGWAKAITTSLRGKELSNLVWGMEGMDGTDGRYLDDGAKLLGLTEPQACRLFFDCDWPARFRHALNRAKRQTPEYAQVVSDRIDHFIATEGAE